MTRLHPLRSLLAVLGVALAAGVVASLLPENPYQRWQLLDGTIHGRSRWIYERVHFDPRPIDVAVVGPSRIARAVDADRLQAALTELGTPARVVNFALPEGGRNTNDVITEEMLSAKTPKLLIIGVIEKPSRFGHPAFKYIAPRSMVVDPGYLANVKYLQDLIYLPYRQMRLFAADIAPDAVGLTKTFDPKAYDPDPPPPLRVKLDNGITRDMAQAGPPAELAEGVRVLEAGTRPPILPRSLADVEFGDDRHYVRRMVAAAQKKGVKVAFLFLPYYTGPTAIQEEPLYRQYGPVWNAGFLAPHTELYSDYAHLTSVGANQLTDWLAPLVSRAIAPPEHTQ
ncbi:MAG TPA: hypothetical protein VFW13_00795 [Phenylobacterium sp.]|nr:hypothetical protein [Phenylobacterium sp.]